MKRLLIISATAVIVAGGFSLDVLRLKASDASAESGAAPKTAGESTVVQGGAQNGQPPISASRAAREEKAIQDARRQQLSEKEAVLAAKEQELKKLSAKIEAQIKSLEDSKKRFDESVKSQNAAQKKLQDEKILKMVKLFKTMRGEQAGKFIDGMQENLALALLSRLDTKTVAKLAPFISQPRVLKWITNNLSE
jgi:flagellar motility protein MotE (MotC chaperone)